MVNFSFRLDGVLKFTTENLGIKNRGGRPIQYRSDVYATSRYRDRERPRPVTNCTIGLESRFLAVPCPPGEPN